MGAVQCDACHVAGARVRAVKGRSVLYFCQHHGIRYMKILQAEGWVLLIQKKKGGE